MNVMKSKPLVYFSARHTLSPAMERAMTSLSRHVVIIGEDEEPETAYALINDCDVFLLHLRADISQKLFLLYELGVALVLQKPIIVIRETDLKLSEIFIPKHFHEIELLLTPSKAGSFETCNVFGMTYNLPLTLRDVLMYGYDNSMIFCPKFQAKYIALLLDKIFSLSSHVESLRKKPSNSAISAESGCSKGQIPALSSNKYESDKLKTNLLRNEHKLNKLIVDGISANDTPEIDISLLRSQDEYFTDKEPSEKRIELVQPVISELQDTSREEERLDTSETPSTSDVIYLNDKGIASANTSPLPSPISPREIYYPTALPVYPMELCFPPFQIEKLQFDKHALQIAKTDKFPSIVRRRVMRKEL